MSKVFMRFPMWLSKRIGKSKDKLMLEAAYIYMLMLDRTELSIANEWYDYNNNVFIHFTYEETKSILKCGTTKCWKIYKILKEQKLISVKPQGFGYALMIYVHTPDGSLENKVEERRKNKKAPTVEQLQNRYAAIFDGKFSEEQLNEIEQQVCTLIPDGDCIERREFLRNLYGRMQKAESNKRIHNHFAYFMQMLKNAKYKKRIKKAPQENEHSYNLKLLMDYAMNNTPKLNKKT